MSENPRDRTYNLGLYSNYKFNEKDFIIRKDLGFIAQEFIPEEDVPLALRKIAKDSPFAFAIFPASGVLFDVSTDSYVLYVPIVEAQINSRPPMTPEEIEKLNRNTDLVVELGVNAQEAQSQPKYTDPLERYCCPDFVELNRVMEKALKSARGR
jgi:hypothetical protein